VTKPFALASYTADADLWHLSLLRSSLFVLVSLCSRHCCALVSVALVCGSCLFVYCTLALSLLRWAVALVSRARVALALLLSCSRVSPCLCLQAVFSAALVSRARMS
jgi:hypothetical protein